MKYFYIILASLLFSFLSPQLSLAAEGDLLWTQEDDFSNYQDYAMGVSTDDTGIYVVGVDRTLGLSDDQWRVQKRSKLDGAIIWSKTLNLSIYGEVAYGVAVDSTGVYVVGEDYSAGLGQWHMEKRSLVDGSLIWTQVNNFSDKREIAYKVEVDGTGVYVIGYDDILSNNQQWRMQKRSLSTGALIWDLSQNLGVGNDQAKDIAIDSTGVYVTGRDSSPGSSWQMRLQKRSLSTGALIWDQISNPTAYSEYAVGVSVDSTGAYLVGEEVVLIGPTWYTFFRYEKRNLSTGAEIWSQVSGGSTTGKKVFGIAINNSGLYLVTQDLSWVIEKRNLSTGALVWSKANTLTGLSSNNPFDIEVDSTDIYVVGAHNLGTPNTVWRIEKREIIPPSLPDLTVGSISPLSAVVGSATTFSSVISNTGTAGTGISFNNLFQFDSDANHAVVDGTRTVVAGPLAIGGAENVSVSYTFPSSGTWYVRTCADNDTSFIGTISEANELNNCGTWATVTVTAAPTGTITPADCTITSGTTCIASTAWATSNVSSPIIKNNGATFSTLPSSAGFPTTLFYGLNTLNLFDGTTSLDTAFAFGLASDQGAGGPSCGGSFTSQPTTGLCASGTISPVVPMGLGWGWTCGTGVGQVSCTATNTGSFCPNTVCESGETMLTCPQDCGAKKLEQF